MFGNASKKIELKLGHSLTASHGSRASVPVLTNVEAKFEPSLGPVAFFALHVIKKVPTPMTTKTLDKL